MLSPKEKKEIRALINKKIASTEIKIESYEEMSKPIKPECSIGRISRIDAINNKSVVEATLRKSRETLQRLKYVLNRVDDEDFGLCVNCGNSIPIGRIVLVPESRLCVRCAR